jgi:hypothetical protein
MAAPQEIIAAPLEIYLAPVGTAFPLVDAAPAVAWELIGTSGDKNYEADGVTVTHGQSVEEWRAAGTTGARKAFRTEESLMIEVTLVDLSAAQYARIMDDATVTQTSPGVGVPGQDEFSLLRGLDVQEFALLARGVSPADNTLAAQYEVPRVYMNGEPAPVFTKGAPAGLALSFSALEDTSAGFGTLTIQTDPAS